VVGSEPSTGGGIIAPEFERNVSKRSVTERSARVRILLWHGYLLSGSGSNLYTVNISRIWRSEGHDVLLMCQERHAGEFAFVDAAGGFNADNTRFELMQTSHEQATGRLRVLRPNIGEVLPVYVYDEYEGFTAKRFVDLTDEELERYTSANIRAMVTAIEEHEPDAIITGHEVMGPYIAREACRRTGTEYLAKLHGSALEYAVKEQPERYAEFASAGLGSARVVAGGSNYMVAEASSVVPGWESRAQVVNPGCDVELFRPADRDASAPPSVGYVGKFIASKGVHNLLGSLGLTTTENLNVTIVGYGGFERGLHEIGSALRTNDPEVLETLAVRGDGTQELGHLLEFIDGGRATGPYFARAARVNVQWPGRLEHAALSQVLPYFDVLVVPSILAEAFGMVAAEAAACGVFPIVPDHSGIGEVGRMVEEAIGAPGLLTYDPDEPLEGIARCIDSVFAIPHAERAAMETKAVELARSRWSWGVVADRLLELAAPGE
jgi:glycosyltransferase involved in cell wall biosynthesis